MDETKLTPVEREVLSQEIKEKNCSICARCEGWLFDMPVCGKNYSFPACKRKKDGFKVIDRQ